MEYLTSQFQLVDSADAIGLLEGQPVPEGGFSGVASVFGSVVDSFLMPTIIHRGAFKESLEKNIRGVKILWQHLQTEPIGVPTLLQEGATGLDVIAKLSSTLRGREAQTLLKDGVIDALSIGFDPVDFTIETMPGTETPVRNIFSLLLWEISLVTFGADPMARIVEANSLDLKLDGVKVEPLQGTLTTTVNYREAHKVTGESDPQPIVVDSSAAKTRAQVEAVYRYNTHRFQLNK